MCAVSGNKGFQLPVALRPQRVCDGACACVRVCVAVACVFDVCDVCDVCAGCVRRSPSVDELVCRRAGVIVRPVYSPLPYHTSAQFVSAELGAAVCCLPVPIHACHCFNGPRKQDKVVCAAPTQRVNKNCRQTLRLASLVASAAFCAMFYMCCLLCRVPSAICSIKKKGGVKLFYAGFETCFGWDPRHLSIHPRQVHTPKTSVLSRSYSHR